MTLREAARTLRHDSRVLLLAAVEGLALGVGDAASGRPVLAVRTLIGWAPAAGLGLAFAVAAKVADVLAPEATT